MPLKVQKLIIQSKIEQPSSKGSPTQKVAPASASRQDSSQNHTNLEAYAHLVAETLQARQER
ncbi:MAG: hypothetical protein AAFQ08_02295, partial [Bacteroidota bacterium]